MRANERMTQRVAAPAQQEARRPADTDCASPRQTSGTEAQRRFQQAMRRAEQGATDERWEDGSQEASLATPGVAPGQQPATPGPDRGAAPDAAPSQDNAVAAVAPHAPVPNALGRTARWQDAASPAALADALGTPHLPSPTLAVLPRAATPDLPPAAPQAPPSATWLALQRSALATEGPSPQWRLLLPDAAGPAHAVALRRTAGGRLALQVQLNAAASPEALVRLGDRLARHAAHLDDASQEEAQS